MKGIFLTIAALALGAALIGVPLAYSLGWFVNPYCHGSEVWDWHLHQCVLKCPPTGCT